MFSSEWASMNGMSVVTNHAETAGPYSARSRRAPDLRREAVQSAKLLIVGFVHQWEPGTHKRTILLLHGTGGDENDLLALGRQVAPDAAFLSPRGKVLEYGMPRFLRRLAEGVFDLDDRGVRTHELTDWIAESGAKYGFDARAAWRRWGIQMAQHRGEPAVAAAGKPGSCDSAARDAAL